jgi:hypothetical protein
LNFKTLNNTPLKVVLLLTFIFYFTISCSSTIDDETIYDFNNLPDDLSNSILYKSLDDDIKIFTNNNHHEILNSDEQTKYYWPTISYNNESMAYSYITEQQADYKIGIDLINFVSKNTAEIYKSISPTKNILSNNIPHYMSWAPKQNILNYTAATDSYPSLFIYRTNKNTSEKLVDFGPLWVNWNDNNSLSVHRRDKRFVFEVTEENSQLINTENVSLYYRIDAWLNNDEIISIFQDFNIIGIVKSDIVNKNNLLLENINEYPMINISPDKKYLSIVSSDNYPASVYKTFSLYDINNKKTVLELNNSPVGYFWSPDSSKLLLITKPDESDNYQVNIVYINDLSTKRIQSMKFTSEQLEMFIFSDQFSNSHKLWSDDSTEILITGDIEFKNLLSEGSKKSTEYNVFKISNLESNPIMTKLFNGTIAYWTNSEN